MARNMDDDINSIYSLKGNRGRPKMADISRPESPEQRLRQMGARPESAPMGNLPHYEAAPVRNPEVVDTFLRQIPGAVQGDSTDLEMNNIPPHIRQRMAVLQQQRTQQQQISNNSGYTQQRSSNNGYGPEIDASAMLSARVMQQSQQTGTAHITEGHTFYRMLQIGGYGGSTPIVRAGGPIPSNVASVSEFVIKGTRNCFIVQPNQTTIDMNYISNNPHLLVPLIEIQNPMVGTLLVEREALMGGRQLMNDGTPTRMQRQQPNDNNNGERVILNSAYNRNMSGRGILKG